jgi:hypothetical protein
VIDAAAELWCEGFLNGALVGFVGCVTLIILIGARPNRS